jgi:glycosyltransferase involved in cell wall biosynthesis
MTPKVVVCTPTKNRRWTWEFSCECMRRQILQPAAWVVVDNSTSSETSWNVANYSSLLIYEHVDEEKPIGWLRNRCLELALEQDPDYIVFWDDDDYYPPTRISTGVKALEANPSADIAASSKMHILLVRENVMMVTGPFHDNHGTAATQTVRASYARTHRFNPEKVRGEELDFTMEWKSKMVQVPAEETIVVMGHGRNTVDKSDLLARPRLYNSVVLNSDNGKMLLRTRWPVPWDLWRSTFSGVGCVSLRDCTLRASG